MLDREDYYLVNDPDFCVSSLRYGIHFLRHNWTTIMAGRPTITTILQRQHLGLKMILFLHVLILIFVLFLLMDVVVIVLFLVLLLFFSF